MDPTQTHNIYALLIPCGDAVELEGEEAVRQWNLAVTLANQRTGAAQAPQLRWEGALEWNPKN